LIETTHRGYFKITPRGQELLETNPAKIDNNVLSQFEEFRQFKEKSAQDTTQNTGAAEPIIASSQTATPDESMRLAHKQIDASLAQDLLDRIHSFPPEFFERLIVKLLLNMGYGGSAADAGRAIGGSGDDGVDGAIDQDALGLDRVYVQAKRYKQGNNIGSGAIRDFSGASTVTRRQRVYS
jgi:restriction system protein